MNNEIKETLSNKNNISSMIALMSALSKRFHEMYSLLQMINTAYGVVMISLLTSAFTNIILLLNIILFYVLDLSQNQKTDFWTYYEISTLIIFFFFIIISMAYLCNAITSEVTD